MRVLKKRGFDETKNNQNSPSDFNGLGCFSRLLSFLFF